MARFTKTPDQWEDARIQLERSPEAAASSLRLLFESELLLVAFDYATNPEDALAIVNAAILKLAGHREKLARMTWSHAINYIRLACTNLAIDHLRKHSDPAVTRFSDLGQTEEWEPVDDASGAPFREVEARDEQDRALEDQIRPLLEPVLASFLAELGPARRRVLRQVLLDPRRPDRNETSRSYFGRIGGAIGISSGRAEVYWSEIKTVFLDSLRSAVPAAEIDRAELDEVFACLARRSAFEELVAA